MRSRAQRRATPRLILAVLAALVPALAGCGAPPSGGAEASPIEGTGEIQTETRDLAPFTRVSVAAPLKVIIGAAGEQEVSLAAQGNVLMGIKTEVVEGQLIVTIPPPGVASPQPMAITIRVPALESVALSSHAVGYVEHTGGDLNLDVSGGAEMTAIGDTPSLTLTASAGSRAMLGELVAQVAQLSINDGSTVEVSVVSSVTGTADGGSTVILQGDPAQEQIEVSSGASVQHG